MPLVNSLLNDVLFCGWCVSTSALLHSHAAFYQKTLNVAQHWTSVKLPVLQSLHNYLYCVDLFFFFCTFCVVTTAHFLSPDHGAKLCSTTKLVRWLYFKFRTSKHKDNSAIFVNGRILVETRHKSCQGMMLKQAGKIYTLFFALFK